jgi:hypothetical protein
VGSLDIQRLGTKLVKIVAGTALEAGISFTKQDITESGAQGVGNAEGPSGLDKAYEILLDALGFGPLSINAPIHRTGLAGP